MDAGTDAGVNPLVHPGGSDWPVARKGFWDPDADPGMRCGVSWPSAGWSSWAYQSAGLGFPQGLTGVQADDVL